MIVKGLVTPWYIFSSKAGPLDVGKNLCCSASPSVVQCGIFDSPTSGNLLTESPSSWQARCH